MQKTIGTMYIFIITVPNREDRPRPTDSHTFYDLLQNAFEKIGRAGRSVAVVVENGSSVKLSGCKWYPRHGRESENFASTIYAGGRSEMLFTKTSFAFYGVSGYFAYTIKRGLKTRIMIVAFSVPMRGNTNTVSVITFDESDRGEITPEVSGVATYLLLKQHYNNPAKIQETLETALFEVSPSNGVKCNPSIRDSNIGVQIDCSISSGNHANLSVRVIDL